MIRPFPKIVAAVAKDCLEKLPDGIESNDVSNYLKKAGATNPLNICLRQEIEAAAPFTFDLEKAC